MKQATLLNLVLIGIILVMGFFLIFRKPEPVIQPFDDSKLKEQVRIADSTSLHWRQEAAAWRNLANNYSDENDSLINLKIHTKIYYNEKYIINANADVRRLDSIIRANW